jgi:hypothetical protein
MLFEVIKAIGMCESLFMAYPKGVELTIPGALTPLMVTRRKREGSPGVIIVSVASSLRLVES